MKRAVPERSEMFGTTFHPLLLGTLALGACAVAPPQGPTIVALPPADKDLTQFQQEDNTCRGYAQQRIGYGSTQQPADGSAGTGATGGAGNALVPAAGLQQRYDIAYAQCMTASGDQLQAFPVACPHGPYGYPTPIQASTAPGLVGRWLWAFSTGSARALTTTLASSIMVSAEDDRPTGSLKASGAR
jgi:hypothetical protein